MSSRPKLNRRPCRFVAYVRATEAGHELACPADEVVELSRSFTRPGNESQPRGVTDDEQLQQFDVRRPERRRRNALDRFGADLANDLPLRLPLRLRDALG